MTCSTAYRLAWTYILHIRLSEVVPGALSGSEQFVQWVWVGVHGLLKEPVEQQAAAACGASVEAEGVLVEVVGQVLLLDPVVQGADQPAFEQGGDQVHAGQHRGLVGGAVGGGGLVGEASVGESA